MAYLNDKLEQLEQAMKKWKESLDIEFSEMHRDAAIQRFEFTFELLWKTVKVYLSEIENIECYSPNACFREVRNTLDLNDEDIEVCLKMAKDRNFSVHIYSQEMADDLYKKMDNYLKITKKIVSKIKDKS